MSTSFKVILYIDSETEDQAVIKEMIGEKVGHQIWDGKMKSPAINVFDIEVEEH